MSSLLSVTKMSKEVLILTIIGTTIITSLLSTTGTSRYGGILSLPLFPVVNVWALNVTGTEGPDTLTGTAEKDYIYGYGGDDRISGLEEDDRIRGGKGDDTIHGDDGRDRILGGSGNDVIFGDDGNDVLIGGPGDDTLTGGLGKDTFRCGEGNDTVMDFNRAEDTINATAAGCENMIPSSSPTTEDTDIDAPTKQLETDDTTKNIFNIPLDQEDGEDDGGG